MVHVTFSVFVWRRELPLLARKLSQNGGVEGEGEGEGEGGGQREEILMSGTN